MSLEKLNKTLDNAMEKFADSENLMRLMEPGFIDKRLYAIYLTETYHYTFHNSRHQALVATQKLMMPIPYIKYCLKHAEEEAGHELMAFHDLKNLGYQNLEISQLPEPLLETKQLIGYLYHISTNGNPLGRLGYSYWAERSYEYITPLMNLITGSLKIQKSSMSFLGEHSEIDKKHAEEVENTIKRFAKTEADWDAIEEVMLGSLQLTVKMMDAILEQFIHLKENKNSRYNFL